MSVNRSTFLNALLSLHTAAELRELPEDALNNLFPAMGLSSDDAVTMINAAQKDALVHLRWRGYVTLTEKGRAVAEGKGSATHAASSFPTGPLITAASAIRIDTAAGQIFGAVQGVRIAGDEGTEVEAVMGAANALALIAAKAEPDKEEAKAALDRLNAALAKLPQTSDKAATGLALIRKASGTIGNWIAGA